MDLTDGKGLRSCALGLGVLVAVSLVAVQPAHAEIVSGIIGLTSLITSVLGASAITIGAATITASAIGGALLSIGAAVAFSAASSALQKAAQTSPGVPTAVAANVGGLRITTRAGVVNRQMVIGRVLKSGVLSFEDVRGPYLYRQFVLAAHPIDGVEQYRIGTTTVPVNSSGLPTARPYYDSSQPKYFLQFSTRLGDVNQLMDPLLAADYPALDRNFRQRGLPTVTVKLYCGANTTEQQSIWGNTDPNVLFVIRGKKFYDPRDPTQVITDSSTWKFTRNAALCAMGWFTDEDGGQASWSSVNIPYLITAANVCDELVPKLDGTTEPRYCTDGVIDTGTDPNQIFQDLLLSFLGEATVIDGKLAVVAGKSRSPTRTLTMDSARGNLESSSGPSFNSVVNTVRTSFVSAERDFQVASGSIYRDYDALASDGAEKSVTVEFPYVTSQTQVQRSCKHIIARSRMGRSIRRGEDVEVIRVTPTDIVRFEYSGGLSVLAGNYEITRISKTDRLDVSEIEALEYDGDRLYGWNPSTDQIDWSVDPTQLAGSA